MNNFGGDWTEEKLVKVEGYLKAYLTALKHQNFTLNYIDAFAGAGYRTENKNNKSSGTQQKLTLSPELGEEDTNKYREGSAVKALNINPGFDRYLFIDQVVQYSYPLEH